MTPRRVAGGMGRLAALLMLSLWLAFAAAPLAHAQLASGPAVTTDALEPPDYKSYERTAARAEKMIEDRTIVTPALEKMRGYLVEWRATLLAAQGINATRITTIRQQIDALGPAPADGATEDAEIAARRKTLTAQLAELQAPVIAAQEAHRRADGLIGEIDRVLRERQAAELLQLWPTPLNPANWTAAASALSAVAVEVFEETEQRAGTEAARDQTGDNLPLIAVLTVVGMALLWRGRRLMEALSTRLQEHASVRSGKVWALLVSIGQIVLPVAGIVALSQAITLTGMTGPRGTALVEVLPALGFFMFSANWMSLRVFPKADSQDAPLKLSAERRKEGRFYIVTFGWMIALDALRLTALNPAESDNAATSVLVFPVLTVAGVLLARIGQLCLVHMRNDTEADEPTTYRNRLIGLLGRAAIAIGVIGPVLAAIGYVSAATALVYPAAVSMGLFGLLFVLQTLIGDLYTLATRREDSRDALLPVLVGFLLILAMTPLFALVWGARLSDLTEMWTRFSEGFQLGTTRVSPSNFLFFLVLFAIGYGVTRMFQGALKMSILPKTRVDLGGQRSIVAGVGYIGIFLSALIAIKSAGIDLSGLAIVAGALSVGIGFGLQNIVSNFVSGIILLIERPVSEGDWVEVGTTQGIVKSISVRSTRIQTFDRTDVIVPNTDFVAGRVTNWTRFNLLGRLIVPVTVPFTSDSRLVEKILRDIAEAQPLALLNPPPVVAFVGFGGETMMFEIRVILRDVNFSLQVKSEINHQIAERFAAAGIAFSNAHRDYLARVAGEAEAARLAEEEQAEAMAALREGFLLQGLPSPEAAKRSPDTDAKDTTG
ncbi:DUF3772 domain-containing protein [Cereibacter changlensis]|nr:DUF3772 domain-containing protein [Cereibacter changlensis]PZX48809.1 small-conductance mechanosensitive channel [Cereibacter changlensis]